MELGECAVWQIAAGDTDRCYYDLCLQWGVVIFGPGYCGVWPECASELAEDSWTTRKIGLIQKFCEEVSDGDVVVLRLGTSEVYAAGRVVGPAVWYDDFGDIDGWDLQFVRRVRWLWRYSEEPKTFPTYSLKLGDTIQSLDSEVVLEWLAELEVPGAAEEAKLVGLPDSCVHGESIEAIAVQEVAESLFDEGVAADSIDALVAGMGSLCRIASWYERSETQPSESETIAYLVVPLLRALGWTPQRMAIEWSHVDLALFSCLPRRDENMTAAVEVKKRNASCLSAKDQGASYAEQDGREGCRRLILTDGIRYGVYLRRATGEFPSTPDAYLNLERMMRSYPILECGGASEALRFLAPDGSPPGKGNEE